MHRLIYALVVIWILVVQLDPASSQNVPGYLGCFRDSQIGILSGTSRFDNSMTVELCFKYCLDLTGTSYKYAGLEAKWVCLCGNNDNYYRLGQVSDAGCRKTCGGNNGQYCGGRVNKKMSIYQISQGVCSNDIGPPSYGRHSITNPPSFSYNLNDFKFLGTRVQFDCDSGYTLQGAWSIECIDTGNNVVTWNAAVPTCQLAPTTVGSKRVAPTTVATTTAATTPAATTPAATTAVTTTAAPSTTVPAATAPLATVALTTDTPLETRRGVPTRSGEATTEEPVGRPTTGGSGTAQAEESLIGTSLGIAAALLMTAVLLVFLLILIRNRRRRQGRKGPEGGPGQAGVCYHNNLYGTAHSDDLSPPPAPRNDHYYSVLDRPAAGDDVYADIDDVDQTGAGAGRAGSASPKDGQPEIGERVREMSPGTSPADKATDIQDTTEWVDNIIYE